MADELFIDDGFSRSHTIPANPGLHPAVAVVFRPALGRERTAYGAKLATKDPEQIDRFESDLIARHVKELNGEVAAVWSGRIARIHPVVRAALIDLILSYTPAQEVADAKNS